MAEEAFPAQLQLMIDRASTLTAQETESLGQLWESDEELVLPAPSFGFELQGGLDVPMVTNKAILDSWQHALDTAGEHGRVDEIEAARAAGRAAVKDVRHLHDSESSKNCTEEAVRSDVLAVGVRDLISDADYQALVRPWQKVLGPL